MRILDEFASRRVQHGRLRLAPALFDQGGFRFEISGSHRAIPLSSRKPAMNSQCRAAASKTGSIRRKLGVPCERAHADRRDRNRSARPVFRTRSIRSRGEKFLAGHWRAVGMGRRLPDGHEFSRRRDFSSHAQAGCVW